MLHLAIGVPGSAGVLFDLDNGRPRYYLAGALSAMAFITPDRLLLARQDGEVRVYDFGASELIRTFRVERPLVSSTMTVTDTGTALATQPLFVLAGSGRLDIVAQTGQRVGRTALSEAPVWMEKKAAASQLDLLVLGGDGRLLGIASAAIHGGLGQAR